MTTGRASTLNQFLEFRNGKTSPDRTGEGAYAVFGSNGEIGRSDSTNASGPLVVIGRVGSYCGSLFYSETDAWVTDNAIVCSSKDSKDVRYWYYALQTLDLNGRSSGSGQPLLNQSVLGAIAFDPPEMDARQAIAEVLGALDDKIAANIKLAASLTGLLDAQFEQLGVNCEPQDDSQIVSLDELIELNPKVAAPKEAEPVYVDMQKLPTAGMSISGWERRPAKGGARFMNDDTLMARITPCLENRKTGFVDFLPDGEAAIGSTEFIVMRSRPGIPKQLSYFLATSERFRTYAIRHMVGTSGRQRVSALNLAGYAVSKPDPEALARFGEISTAHFKLLKSLTDENRTLAATRDTLLPEMISGKLRVKDADRVLEDAEV
ncbi:restriction endonuclease subunit S [Pseudarthrobacter sp. NS4]|uniref:restriction endonuclease subunit S n=1 Tax=Pseudarthrobacter sp. NS4 TaxID=2973976 RepID=UPI002162D539|nr:restriction endonuclease subunit S [Pseudarthrobacter sp. NS4]